jgi:hypothetical protein
MEGLPPLPWIGIRVLKENKKGGSDEPPFLFVHNTSASCSGFAARVTHSPVTMTAMALEGSSSHTRGDQPHPQGSPPLLRRVPLPPLSRNQVPACLRTCTRQLQKPPGHYSSDSHWPRSNSLYPESSNSCHMQQFRICKTRRHSQR